jgi:hypothetical protein
MAKSINNKDMNVYRKLTDIEWYLRNERLLFKCHLRRVMLLAVLEQREQTEDEKAKAGRLLDKINQIESKIQEANANIEKYRCLKRDVLAAYDDAKILGMDRDFVIGWFDNFYSEGERDATIIFNRIVREFESIN